VTIDVEVNKPNFDADSTLFSFFRRVGLTLRRWWFCQFESIKLA
jgi:hypothetical protein